MTKKFTKSALCMFILAAALAAFSTSASSAPAYTANFDTDTVGATPTGWTPTGGTAFATSAQFISAPNSMYIDRTTINVGALSPSFGSLAEKVTIQFWVRPANDTPANQYTEFDIRDSAGTTAIVLWLVGGATPGLGKFQYQNSGGTWVTLCTGTAYSPLTWYRFKITTDPTQVSDTYDINIYNSAGTSVCAVNGLVYRNNVANLDKFYFLGGNTANSDFWVDDLRVTRYSTLSITATASNPAAANIGPSGVRVPMLSLALAETKAEEDVNISSLKFMASGAGNDATNITASSLCLYNDLGTTGQYDTLDTLIACSSYAADNATATFSALNQTISAGTTKNWLLTQDMNGTAANASTFVSTLNQSATYITAYARSGYTDSDKTATLSPAATLTSNTMTVTLDSATPAQSAWSPAAASTLNTATPTITFTTNENAWCAWATTDISFASTPVSNNCSGGGTTSQSCAVTNVFTDGPASIYLSCRDAAYNLDSSTTNTAISYTIDLTAPAQSAWSPANAATITTTTPTVTLTTNENATCRWALTDLGYTAMTNTCSGGGTTSQSCSVTGLSQGAGSVYISCVDAVSNSHTSANNTALAYFVDSLAPVQSSWSPAKTSNVTTTAPTVTFTTDENATCRWALSDLAYASMTNACSGAGTTSQSCAVTGLSQGAVTVYAACADSLSNANTIADNEHIAYTVDSLPPVQSAWSPAAASTIILTSQTVTFTVDENATCRWALSDLGYASMTNACSGAGTTSQSCAVAGMAEGANSVSLSCVDALANQNTSADNTSLSYTVDTTPPVQSAWSPASSTRVASTTQAITFTTNENATCRWALTDIAYGTMTNSCSGAGTASQSCAATGLTSGATTTVYTACVDANTNADTIASNTPLSYFADITAPAQSSWSPAKTSVVTTTAPTITFTTDENATCRWDVSDLAYGFMTNSCSGAGTTSQSCAVTGLSQGAATVYTGCIDSLSNANTIANNEHIAYTIDSAPPVQSAWSPAASTTVTTNSQTVTFTTGENATCRWALTDLSYASMTNACSGGGTTSQSCAATGFAEGANQVYISCVDSQANANTASDNSAISYILDTTPPAKTSISPADGSRISSSSQSVTFTTNENATCRWALTDLAYGSMTNACSGAASTNQSCPVSALVSGATNTVYIACSDAYSNADTIASNQQVQYRIDTGAPTFAGVEDAVACGSGCFNVYWSAGSDPEGSTPITYSVYAAITSGGQNFAAANTTTTATGAQITGLSNDTAYYIVVRAADAAGNSETNTVERIGITTAVPTLTKYTGNPVMSGDGEGFDALGTLASEVYYDGSLFHMWYSGRSSSTTLPGYAVSLDGVNWATMTGTATGGALFDVNPDTTAFDATAVAGGRVMVNPPTSSSKYYMWYEGNRSDRPNTLRIGLAQSTDGISWQRVPGPADGASIFTWTPGTFDNYMAYAPSVIYEGGMYKMWYTGTDQNVASASYFYRIGYATSADGITWNKYTGSGPLGSVMDMGRSGAFDRPRATHPNVYKENNIYKMFYSGFDNANSAIGKYRLGYAASPDGLNWTKQPGSAPEGAILDVGATYDGVIAAESSLQIINGGFHLWYVGYNGTPNQYYVMYANNTGVMPPKITNITISTTSASSVQPGTSVVYSAVCDYAAVNPYCGAASCVCTNAVAWSSSNASAMTVNQLTGAASAVASGSASIVARCSGVTSNTSTITVDGQAPSFSGVQSVAQCGSGCLDLSWTAATDSQNSTPVTYNVYMASATAAENFASASYQTSSATLRLTGLTNRQRYFFVVRAQDTAANEDTNTVELYESPVVSDTTAPPAVSWVYDGPGPSDATYSTSAAQLSALWSSVTDPESLILAYWYAIGSTSGGTDVKTWTSAGTATSVAATGLTLTNGAKYYVSVKAQNEADLYSVPTVSNGVTIDSAAPTALITSPAANTSTSGSVSIIGTVYDVTLTSWILSYGPGASPSAWVQIATGSTSISAGTLATWNTSSLGGVYTLKLVASDTFGNTSVTTNSFTLNNTATITGSAAQFKWVLISVPVQPVSASPISMFGVADYKIYRWDPSAVEDQYTYKYRAPSSLSAGHAIWLKSYISNFTYTYTGTQTDTTQTYSLPLSSGWNMIGVPFNRNFDWNSVQVLYNGVTYDLASAAALNIISTTLQGYDSSAGSFTQNGLSAVMTPQAGYFVRAYSDCSLLFGPGVGKPGGIARIVRSQDDYRIKLSASARESADLDNYIGASSGAKEEYDALDAEEPPRPVTDKFTSLYFTNQSWSRNAGRYTNDIRPRQTRAGQASGWDFNVDTNETGETVTLAWDSASLPADRYSFTLVNTATGERVDMTKTGSYSYTATGAGVSSANFRVEIVKLETELVTETMALTSGWNLISVPLEPEVTNALSQIPGVDVFQYSAGEFFSASQADIQAGTGLWARVGGNTTIDIKGSPVPDGRAVSVPLAPGWNIIGNPYKTPLAWGDNITLKCGSADPQPISSAAASGAVSSAIYMYNGESYEALPAGGALQPWRGYFIKSAASCDLALSQ